MDHSHVTNIESLSLMIREDDRIDVVVDGRYQ